MHHRRRHNPSAVGSPKTWILGGAGALAGFVGSAALPQMLMPTSNTGMTGYAMTAAATLALGFASHFFLPRQPAVTAGVVAGGFANLLRRVISDQTPYGPLLSNPGMGDYMVANWGPPRLPDALHSAMAEPLGTPWSGGGGMVTTSSGVNAGDLSDMRSSRPC